MKTFEAYTMCHKIKSNVWKTHVQDKKTDDKDIKKDIVILLDCTKYM